jgi:L-fucose dehydrogenase
MNFLIMNLQLQNKVVIVTGGAKGIGEAISTSLAEEGAIPVIFGRSEDENIETIAKIKGNGGVGYHYKVELSNPAECKDAVENLVRDLGRIDGVVNNAGVNDGVSLEGGSYEGFMSSLHKNLIHYYLVVHYALPELKKSENAAILNITSKTAETGQGGTSAYAAANGGRNALTREWAVELLKYQIRVNSIVVSECFTPMYASWIKKFSNPEEKLAAITSKIPFQNRMTKASEIADMAVFLLSERSGHTTGQLIHVDGGYVHLDRALINS